MSGSFSGTVASFNPSRGWGYIHSQELFEEYGKDVFLHKDFMEHQCGEGDQVTFEIELRADGKPQARNIRTKGKATKARSRANPRASQPVQQGRNGQRFQGQLVSYNPAKGWGYIHCAPLFQQYGKDVFLHRDYIEEGFGADIGDTVSFAIDFREDGMPQARNITGAPKYNMGAGWTASGPARSGVYSGSIVSFNPAKGWGYIHCAELFQTFGKDVFLHRDYVLEGFTANIGDIVSFSIELREDGMPQARNIQKGGGRHKQPMQQQQPRKRGRAAAADGGRHSGTIASFNFTKGWGYISSPELLAHFGKDVFLHRDYVEPGFEAEQGDTVSFSVEVREDGKPQARDIKNESRPASKRRRQ